MKQAVAIDSHSGGRHPATQHNLMMLFRDYIWCSGGRHSAASHSCAFHSLCWLYLAQWRSQFAARLIPQAAVVNILLRTCFNTLMHVVKESSGGEHPAAFLLAGVLARRMACRGDSHPAKRAMYSERKLFCVR